MPPCRRAAASGCRRRRGTALRRPVRSPSPGAWAPWPGAPPGCRPIVSVRLSASRDPTRRSADGCSRAIRPSRPGRNRDPARCAAWNSVRASFQPKLCMMVTPRRKWSWAGPLADVGKVTVPSPVSSAEYTNGEVISSMATVKWVSDFICGTWIACSVSPQDGAIVGACFQGTAVRPGGRTR